MLVSCSARTDPSIFKTRSYTLPLNTYALAETDWTFLISVVAWLPKTASPRTTVRTRAIRNGLTLTLARQRSEIRTSAAFCLTRQLPQSYVHDLSISPARRDRDAAWRFPYSVLARFRNVDP